MKTIFLLYLTHYLLAFIFEVKIASTRTRNILISTVIFSWFATLFVFSANLTPYIKLIASCLGTLCLIKILVRGLNKNLTNKSLSFVDEIILRFIWPGMSDKPFFNKKLPEDNVSQLFIKGYFNLLFGIALLVLVAIFSNIFNEKLLGFIGVIPILLTVHFGYSNILVALLKLNNIPVLLLFDAPFTSNSLSEFWGRRWNYPFVEMNRKLFFDSLVRKYSRSKIVLFTFFISGLLHELGVSYPANGGWGLPTIYFLLQGLFVVLEGLKASK